MYQNLQKINDCKERYKIISTEIKKLQGLSPLTKSGAEKRKAIPKLKEEQEKIKSEFDSLVPQIGEWVKTFPERDMEYGKIIVAHYCNFEKGYNKLQDTIDDCGLMMKASNFDGIIQRIWLNQLKK